jgi:hypothetical protein
VDSHRIACQRFGETLQRVRLRRGDAREAEVTRERVARSTEAPRAQRRRQFAAGACGRGNPSLRGRERCASLRRQAEGRAAIARA